MRSDHDDGDAVSLLSLLQSLLLHRVYKRPLTNGGVTRLCAIPSDEERASRARYRESTWCRAVAGPVHSSFSSFFSLFEDGDFLRVCFVNACLTTFFFLRNGLCVYCVCPAFITHGQSRRGLRKRCVILYYTHIMFQCLI